MQEIKNRKDMVRFIKRCLEMQGKNPWHFAYRKSKTMSDEELKAMVFDYALNFDEAEMIEDLDGRTNRFKRDKEGIKFKSDWKKYRYDTKEKQD